MSKLENNKTRLSVPEDSIGDRIKEAREARGWTQAVLSTRCKMADTNGEGIGRSVLANYEVGKTKPGAREMRILCEALCVTPNWLLYRQEQPLKATQESLKLLQGSEFFAAIRLAFALLTLKPHEREALGSLALSLAGRQLNDMGLSSLLAMANLVGSKVIEDLETLYPSVFSEKTLDAAMKAFVEQASKEIITNIGNRLDINEDGVIGGEWLYKSSE